jgi:hypothetical protein
VVFFPLFKFKRGPFEMCMKKETWHLNWRYRKLILLRPFTVQIFITCKILTCHRIWKQKTIIFGEDSHSDGWLRVAWLMKSRRAVRAEGLAISPHTRAVRLCLTVSSAAGLEFVGICWPVISRN